MGSASPGGETADRTIVDLLESELNGLRKTLLCAGREHERPWWSSSQQDAVEGSGSDILWFLCIAAGQHTRRLKVHRDGAAAATAASEGARRGLTAALR